MGEGTEFEGLLSFDGTVRIDGKFKGEINTDDCLIIGESGHIEAEIKVGHLIVMGTFHGNVHAVRKVEVVATGKIFGDVVSPALIVQEGGLIEGNLRMKGVEEQLAKKVINIQDARGELSSQPKSISGGAGKN